MHDFSTYSGLAASAALVGLDTVWDAPGRSSNGQILSGWCASRPATQDALSSNNTVKTSGCWYRKPTVTRHLT